MIEQRIKPRSKRRAVLIVTGTGLLACAFMAGLRAHVLAEGAPTKQPLFYSGTLEAGGMPANGEYTVTMTLHDAATAGNELCGVESKATVEAGRFRIDASDCQEAVAMEPDSWVAVSFAGSDGVVHEIPGRAKIGAVPYALEARHAVSASTPSGALATTVQQLTERVSALEAGSAQSSAFLAYKSSAQSIATGGGVVVVFNEEQVDIASEYEPSSGRFTAKAAGLYEFSCTIAWDLGGNSDGTYEVALQLNDYEHTYNGSAHSGEAVTRSITGVIELAPGDRVACTALNSYGPSPLHVSAESYNTFSGHRIR